jgi:aryl-alcohol dehydrogenase-like predicted oxidoreductase
MGVTSEQSLYNLAVRAVEMEIIPALRSLGTSLILYSPLHPACSPEYSKLPPSDASRTNRYSASRLTVTS